MIFVVGERCLMLVDKPPFVADINSRQISKDWNYLPVLGMVLYLISRKWVITTYNRLITMVTNHLPAVG